MINPMTKGKNLPMKKIMFIKITKPKNVRINPMNPLFIL